MKLFAENVKIDRIDLTSSNGKVVGIGPQLLAMRIQEDVTTPFIAAEVDIADGIGLIQSFPIIGEEKLDVTISVMNTDRLDGNSTTQLKYQFYVYGVGNLGFNEKASGAVYTLKAISIEAITNAAVLTEKAYKSTYDSAVKDILTSLIKTKKPILADPSLGVQDLVLPNMKPFRAIDMLRKRATSSKYPFSPFLFFETRTGFKFRDVVSLFEAGKAKGLEDITYKQRNYQAGFQDRENDRRSLISFTAPEKNDTFNKINNGAFNNKITTFDLITKKLTPYAFNLSSKMKSFNTFNGTQPHTDAFVSDFSATPSRTYIVPIDSTRPNLFVDRFGDRQSYTNLIFQHYSQAEMNGSPTLEAGEVVYLDIKSDLQSSQRGVDGYNSGYYLVKSVTHEIHVANGVPVHRMGCDLIRGSTLERLK